MQTKIHQLKLFALVLVLPFVFGPQVAQAQSATERAVLLETIQTLLAQIEVLQELLDQRQSAERTVDAIDDFEGDIVAEYRLSGDLVLPFNANAETKNYTDRLRAVLPDKYDDYFDRLVVFSADRSDTAAFVAVASDGRTTDWVYGLNAEELELDPVSDASTELMIHEFAHVFTLDQFLTSAGDTGNCHEFFDATGCFAPGTYLSEFVQEFWDDELLDELVGATEDRNSSRELERLYERYDDEFVTDYAATDPSEDFAETFAWYVLGLDVEQGSVAENKLEFMDSFPSIRAYKKEILSSI